MTDDELQQYCDQTVRLKHGDQVLTGKLICGAAAQLAVDMPYAIETTNRDAAHGTADTHLAGIAGPEAIESIEVVEPVDEEIRDAAEDAQTPG